MLNLFQNENIEKNRYFMSPCVAVLQSMRKIVHTVLKLRLR